MCTCYKESCFRNRIVCRIPLWTLCTTVLSAASEEEDDASPVPCLYNVQVS